MGNMPNGILILLLLCILLICQFHTEDAAYSNVTCIESERRALLEFRGSLVDNANRLASWTFIDQDCCSWYGITCNHRTGHVEKLNLRNPIQTYFDEYTQETINFDFYVKNSLRGEINPSILNLEHLNYLDLSCNNFSRIQIPTFLGSLKNLRYLNLLDAGFSGEIPPHLGNLSNLQYLSLGLGQSDYGITHNLLSAKSLKWITGLSSLKALDLSAVNLIESLDWLYSVNMLPSLSSLNLRNCRLAGTVSPPLSLVNLTSLISLDLGATPLYSSVLLPLLNLSSHLTVLRLDNNELQDPIPIMWEKLTSLTVLDLSSNYFNSSSMQLHSLCNLTNLISLNLWGNQFQGSLPLCLGNLTSLRELYLEYNEFSGSLPFSLGNLTALRELSLQGNKFSGKIPRELGYLKQLTTLYLSSNYFNSSIPSNFGHLTNLEILDLGYNNLCGPVPSSLGQLTKLTKLDISQNSLTGQLTESHFAKLKSLKDLSIYDNYFLSFVVSSQWVPPFQLRIIQMNSVHLGTQLPPWLQTQTDVLELSMPNTSIFGVIPVWFPTFCSSLLSLDLSNNNIHGSFIAFPPNMQSLDLSNNFLTWPSLLFNANYVTNMSLETLNLRNNHLTGIIPDDLCNLSSLQFLSLANNQLTGRIPPCFGNLWGLYVLDLTNSSLSGHIPSTLGNLEFLQNLHLDRNKFYGLLPSSLKHLTDLTTLDLGENQLTGTIPKWIGNELSNLHFLILQSNNFYGNIPIHLCQLSALQVLNLAQNNLIGHIPHCVRNWCNMRSDSLVLDNIPDAYSETLRNIMKGVELDYSSNLQAVRLISLSTNNLSGEIPSELLDLDELQSLNLSNNNLSGRIPENIGNLRNLESLDLSTNLLSGPIPQSLASIDNLGYLNLSFNNLESRIPSGNHFDTLNDPSIYEGNSGLCGKPLEKSCPDDISEYKGKGHTFYQNIDDEFEVSWFSAGIAPGFAVGLLGVFCILHFKKSWRHAYFGFVENIYDRVCVTFAVKIPQFLKKFN